MYSQMAGWYVSNVRSAKLRTVSVVEHMGQLAALRQRAPMRSALQRWTASVHLANHKLLVYLPLTTRAALIWPSFLLWNRLCACLL